MLIQQLLKEPFLEKEVHWRVGSTTAKQEGCKPWEASKGIPLAYIDARDVMKRLDDVVGVDGWQDEYSETSSGRVICQLSIKINGEWVVKSDGAGNTGTEGEKGAISDAFKRAAVKFGIGRYLYYLPTQWVELTKGKLPGNLPLPGWAKPKGVRSILMAQCSAIRENFESVHCIKLAIQNEKLDEAAEAWHELEEVEKEALRIAPTKGGVFTTEEREVLLHNNMFASAAP